MQTQEIFCNVPNNIIKQLLYKKPLTVRKKPKKQRPPQDNYIVENIDETPKFTYTFAFSALKSVHNLLRFCKDKKLSYTETKDGVKVMGITSEQIDKARKICNKSKHTFPLYA